MPCDTVQTAQVDIGKLDPALADAAIKTLGLSGVSYSNGVLNIQGNQDQAKITQRVRQAYGAEVVKSQASKFGWQLKQTGEFKYQVVKR
jgi:hypothetical protein